MARAILPFLCSLSLAAAGRVSLNYAADLNKDFLKQYEAEKAAKRQAEADRTGAAGAPPPPEPEAATEPGAAAAVARSGGGGMSLGGTLKLPAVIGLGFGAYRGLQTVQLRRLAARLSTGQDELAAMGSSPVVLSAHNGGLRSRIAAHADALQQLADAKVAAVEAAERKAALLTEVGAAYAQLEQKPPAALAQQSEAELDALLAGLGERVQACASLLEAYRALGQLPPDDFRAWPLDKVKALRDNVTARAGTLREVLLMQSKLGGARQIDASLAEMEEEALLAKLAELTDKVEQTQARRAKDVLLGKVEAALWLRRQEAPVGLASMSVDDLEALLDKLNKGPEGRTAT